MCHILCKSWKSVVVTMIMIRQAFGEESMSRTLMFELESPNALRSRKLRQVKSKVKSMLIIFFVVEVIIQKNSSWQAKQSFIHTTVMFYGDCVKLCNDFTPNFGEKLLAVASCQHTFFSPGNFFTKSNMNIFPHPPYSPVISPCNFSLFPWLKISPFWHNCGEPRQSHRHC
jgi:hypothetical protein